MVQIDEVCAIQTKIPLRVTRQDEYLQSLPGLFQHPHHTGEASGVCRNQHVIQNHKLVLALGKHVGQRETCREIDLLTLAA